MTVTRGKCKFFFCLLSSDKHDVSDFRHIRWNIIPMFRCFSLPIVSIPKSGDDKMCLNRREDMNESHKQARKRVAQSYHVCQMKIFGAFSYFAFTPATHKFLVPLSSRLFGDTKYQHLSIILRVTSNRSQWKSKKTLL